MEKWDYRTIRFDRKGFIKSKFDPDEEMNKLSNEGWELVAMFSPVSGMGSSDELFATFKRKKGEF